MAKQVKVTGTNTIAIGIITQVLGIKSGDRLELVDIDVEKETFTFKKINQDEENASTTRQK